MFNSAKISKTESRLIAGQSPSIRRDADVTVVASGDGWTAKTVVIHNIYSQGQTLQFYVFFTDPKIDGVSESYWIEGDWRKTVAALKEVPKWPVYKLAQVLGDGGPKSIIAELVLGDLDGKA